MKNTKEDHKEAKEKKMDKPEENRQKNIFSKEKDRKIPPTHKRKNK